MRLLHTVRRCVVDKASFLQSEVGVEVPSDFTSLLETAFGSVVQNASRAESIAISLTVLRSLSKTQAAHPAPTTADINDLRGALLRTLGPSAHESKHVEVLCQLHAIKDIPDQISSIPSLSLLPTAEKNVPKILGIPDNAQTKKLYDAVSEECIRDQDPDVRKQALDWAIGMLPALADDDALDVLALKAMDAAAASKGFGETIKQVKACAAVRIKAITDIVERQHTQIETSINNIPKLVVQDSQRFLDYFEQNPVLKDLL